MSKPVKNMITEVYKQKFDGLKGGILIDIRGTSANDNNDMRLDLNSKNIKITVVKNSLAKTAFDGTELEALTDFIDGGCALAYPTGEDASVVSVARELVDWAKKLDTLTFRGAVLEGTVFSADEIERLSKFPTREEAQAQVVQLILSPAQNLVGAATSPAKNLAGIIDAIKEKLENGEEITKAS